MDAQFYLDKLANREIKPTAIRILVLKSLLQAKQAVSLLDLENSLDCVDKSTIFRTISLFLSHRLIHSIDDGSGSLKYALCEDACTCEVKDLHSHFYCECCQKTYCFENIRAPIVEIPAGFTVQSVNYVLKGLCPACSSKNQFR
jgi:Fur family ferric uptake transcriptional regulator